MYREETLSSLYRDQEAFHKLLQRKKHEKAKFRNKEKPHIVTAGLHSRPQKENFYIAQVYSLVNFRAWKYLLYLPYVANHHLSSIISIFRFGYKLAGFRAKCTFSTLFIYGEKKIQRKATILPPKKNASKHLENSIKAQPLV